MGIMMLQQIKLLEFAYNLGFMYKRIAHVTCDDEDVLLKGDLLLVFTGSCQMFLTSLIQNGFTFGLLMNTVPRFLLASK